MAVADALCQPVAVRGERVVQGAIAAGLRVERGIVVDDAMRTSAPEVFAAGDVCEFNRQVPGLWPVAVEQARVAALNATGGHEVYHEIVPVTATSYEGGKRIARMILNPNVTEFGIAYLASDKSLFGGYFVIVFAKP